VGTEIERKFVLAATPDWLDSAPAEPIEQGYLAVGDGSEVRLRLIGGRPRLTVKSGAGLSRGEAEIELTEAQFEALWPLTEGRRLSKVRHRRETGDETIEVDVYGGAHDGLIVAEIEFDSTDASARFAPPGWLGTEVTGDDRWANASLALNGSIPAIG
jgi:CYTH domain-containing protein